MRFGFRYRFHHGVRSGVRRPAFTLIEVLVVVAIIAMLVAILLPSLHRAREQSKAVVCETQIGQLMKAALTYTMDSSGRLPGTGVNDNPFASAYNAGTRTDWLTWSGTWQVCVTMENASSWAAWKKVPRNGRLWKYYRSEVMLKCPSSKKWNGKFSYSTPENVSMAMKGMGGRSGLPPLMERVRHPAQAIQFLDEDEENGLSTYSCDDGFGAMDYFGDRHIDKASVAFFDGHAGVFQFPRGKIKGTVKTAEAFRADYIQIAPFNCRYTPEPWKFQGVSRMPKFTRDNNYPGCQTGPGCE